MFLPADNSWLTVASERATGGRPPSAASGRRVPRRGNAGPERTGRAADGVRTIRRTGVHAARGGLPAQIHRGRALRRGHRARPPGMGVAPARAATCVFAHRVADALHGALRQPACARRRGRCRMDRCRRRLRDAAPGRPRNPGPRALIRIPPSAIVRLDQVTELRTLGNRDALLRLRDGPPLRQPHLHRRAAGGAATTAPRRSKVSSKRGQSPFFGNIS
jgi:hypothetical protein